MSIFLLQNRWTWIAFHSHSRKFEHSTVHISVCSLVKLYVFVFLNRFVQFGKNFN